MSTSDAGNSPAETEQKARRELLLQVYSTAIDEYRFNVRLTWDRAKFFLLLNSGLLAAGVGLFKVAADSLLTWAFLALFFLLLILISVCGLETAKIGKSYYREAIFTKTLVERELGLLDPVSGLNDQRANLSIAVTRGQRNYEAILTGLTRASDPSEATIPSGTVAFYGNMVFWLMILIEALAMTAAAVNASIKASP